MLEFCLFGPGEITYRGRKLVGLCHQLPGHLLCYLLLNRERSQDREHLAAIFWGDSSIQGSRKALRNNLWRLRQFLQSAGVPVESYLMLNEESVRFVTSSSYTLDVENFESLVNICVDVNGFDLSSTQIAGLETAVSLYCGDLLEGTYADWCLYDRERLRLMFLTALNKLMVFYGLNKNYEKGIDHGERLLLIDNTLERVHCQLMWLHWMNGNRSAAMTQYKLCCQILREELHCGPMQETQRIYKQMLHDQIDSSDWDEIIGVSGSITSKSPIGNDPACNRIQRELQRLQNMIEDTQATSRVIERLIIEALDK